MKQRFGKGDTSLYQLPMKETTGRTGAIEIEFSSDSSVDVPQFKMA